MGKRKLSYERKKSLSAYLFLLPWLIGFFGLFFRTFISSIIYSFSDLTITDKGYSISFVGLENYRRAFIVDPDFLPTLSAQIKNMVINVPVILIFSLFFAVLLNQKFHLRGLARSIFFLPVIVGSGIVISIIKGDALSNDVINGTRAAGLFESGSFFQILENSGINSDLVNQMMSIVNNIFELSWQSGLQIILFLASLQTVPEQLYEVAKVEGATAWETFFKITLPMITPIMIVNVIYTIVDNFTDYNNKLLLYILNLGRRLDIDYSSALGNIYFIVIFIIIGIVFLLINKKITYIEK